jgi:glucose/arabinose dehydrogenase
MLFIALRRPRPAFAVTAALFALLLAACNRGTPRSSGTPTARTSPSPSASPTPGPSPTPTFPPPNLAQVKVQATLISPLAQPTALAFRKDDPKQYITERRGRLVAVANGNVETVIDISNETSFASEQGLLGLAIPSDGSKMYINFTNEAGDTRVDEFTFREGKVDPATRRNILAQDQPFVNHNGGNLVFGKDGHMWVGLGDGGSRNDPMDNAQSLGTLLGKMLRINPAQQGGNAYTVPPDNPFAGRAGARPEIFALGLRNPWRYSFDRATGDLWIGDVGQFQQEEIDFMPAGQGAGANYGWARLEGTRRVRGTPPDGVIPPIHTYQLHVDGRCAVVGGYVYRGSKIPNLHGAYLYSDNCDGKVRALVQQGGRVADSRDLGLTVPSLSSFGEGPDGEIYLMSLTNGFFRLDPG